MHTGFPAALVSVFRCTADGTVLKLDRCSQLCEKQQLVLHGALLCETCSRALPIEDGILKLLDFDALDDESRRELTIRNDRVRRRERTNAPAWYENEYGRAELIPTLESLSAAPGMMVLELGCGDGRYTLALSEACEWVVAVDFSLESLLVLRQRQQHQNIALVLGDIRTLKVRTAAFDRVLSTLVSNLPSRAARDAMYRLAAAALKPEGRFVFSTHHHGLWQRLSRKSQSGRYRESGIYRYAFTMHECQVEVQRFFASVTVRPIQVHVPLAGRLGIPLDAISGVLESIPLLNKLGDLILCTAEEPIHAGLS